MTDEDGSRRTKEGGSRRTEEDGSRMTEEGLEGYKKVTSVDGREEGDRRRNEEVSAALSYK